jgi:RNA polymerase sigma factor (TIGR02999 family)
MPDAFSVADVLSKAQPGDERSMTALLPLVYDELKLLAARQLAREPLRGRAHTLQPTALVHEAFLKMIGADKGWSGRDHFMAVAATAMRQVLVDHSRRRNAEKRGGGAPRADISIETLCAEPQPSLSPDNREMRVVELDALLDELAASSKRAARVAEMRLFGGMDQDQIARVLGVSRMTIHRDWQVARAWLAGKMQDSENAHHA